MKRKVVHINESKCNGCGVCVDACHESAIEIVDGKAKLISDEYCDGLGDCLHCPENAIELLEREAKAYDDDAVKERQKKLSKIKIAENKNCIGSESRIINRDENIKREKDESLLNQWPVQLSLVNTKATYLKNADILIAADCTAFAYSNFHEKFLNGRVLLVGCPKLDDVNSYKEKLIEIFKNNNINSISVVRMEVPCCGGIVSMTKKAMLESETIVKYNEYTISITGLIK